MNRIKNERLGEEKLNNQGSFMKIIEYRNSRNIIVEFQDKYKAKVQTNYANFIKGLVKNPYFPTVCNVGINGSKYTMCINGKPIKEYNIWLHMIGRCFDKNLKEKYPTYKSVTCCNEWLLYENFYEWLHSQENFDRWKDEDKWCIDKDILTKGNKLYSPDTCCLVPHNVNCLFIRCDIARNELPIGVEKVKNKFVAYCNNPFNGSIKEYLGTYETQEDAFKSYKKYKECLIKQIAQIEFDKGNITEKCYTAMFNYEVEIND